jgi:FtsH-binding integral membrane protein
MFAQRYIWLLIIGVFWLASILATKWSLSLDKSTQYFGLGFYVVLEAIIFLPLIKIATLYAWPQVIYQAAMLTIAMFSGISFIAFTSKRDFSFLRNIIVIGGFISLGLIVGGMLFAFNLGLWFSVGMVILASATILYQTSKLKDSYSTNQYVGASLQLFASIMLLFWYILSILMSRRS